MKETQHPQSTGKCRCCVIPGISKAHNCSGVYGGTRNDWGVLWRIQKGWESFENRDSLWDSTCWQCLEGRHPVRCSDRIEFPFLLSEMRKLYYFLMTLSNQMEINYIFLVGWMKENYFTCPRRSAQLSLMPRPSFPWRSFSVHVCLPVPQQRWQKKCDHGHF